MKGKAALKVVEEDTLRHNLLGQRLGRKGRDTRERILAATQRLLEGPPETAISLSAVAREASLGMTSLYLYFADLTELLLAVLEPITAAAEALYAEHVQPRWSDEKLGEHCKKFVDAYYDHWLKHTRILHLRNSLADHNDERMSNYRLNSAQNLVHLLADQMDGDGERLPLIWSMATVLVTGLERTVTRATEVPIRHSLPQVPEVHVRNTLAAQARLLELGLRDGRETVRSAKRKK